MLRCHKPKNIQSLHYKNAAKAWYCRRCMQFRHGYFFMIFFLSVICIVFLLPQICCFHWAHRAQWPHSLATSYDAWVHRQFSTSQRPSNYLAQHTHRELTYWQVLFSEQRLQKHTAKWNVSRLCVKWGGRTFLRDERIVEKYCGGRRIKFFGGGWKWFISSGLGRKKFLSCGFLFWVKCQQSFLFTRGGSKRIVGKRIRTSRFLGGVGGKEIFLCCHQCSGHFHFWGCLHFCSCLHFSGCLYFWDRLCFWGP